jgi:hypothetical protein
MSGRQVSVDSLFSMHNTLDDLGYWLIGLNVPVRLHDIPDLPSMQRSSTSRCVLCDRSRNSRP